MNYEIVDNFLPEEEYKKIFEVKFFSHLQRPQQEGTNYYTQNIVINYNIQNIVNIQNNNQSNESIIVVKKLIDNNQIIFFIIIWLMCLIIFNRC